MISRSILIISILLFAALPVVSAQEVLVPFFNGRLFAEGREVDWIIEVRLVRSDSLWIASAYTGGTSEFIFRNVSIDLSHRHFLVVKEPGFKELRYELSTHDFIGDPNGEGIGGFVGAISLYLERLPPEDNANIIKTPDSKTVNVKQLMSEISEEARRECDLALEALAVGDRERAIKHLEKAIELSPEYSDALNQLGVEYVRAGQYRKAEPILDRALKLNPNDPLPLTNLGILYFREAEELESASVHDADAESEAVETLYRKALEVIEEAFRLDPHAPRNNFLLGTALYHVGSFERAEKLLINAVALDSQMNEARLTLVNIYTKQARYNDALKQISAYLKANPDTQQREHIETIRAQIESASDQ